MRLNEFTNAEEQLALWKLVSDSVWTALRTQAEQQARERAEKQARDKLKPKRSKASARAPHAPKPPPLKKPMLPHVPPNINSGATSVQQANIANPNKASVNPRTLSNTHTANTQANVSTPTSPTVTPTPNANTLIPQATLTPHAPTSAQAPISPLQKLLASQKQAYKPI
jgi:hypothetical protein